MKEQEREEVALLRYGVISEWVSGELVRGESKRLLALKASRPWRRPDGKLVHYSPNTLKSWIKAYRQGGLDGLKPKSRKDKGAVRALAEEVRQVLLQMRQAHADWGVPELIRHLRQSGLVKEEEGLSLSTVYRLIGKAQREKPEAVDRRKFEFERLLECVQADVMVGPYVRAEGKKRRSYLHVLLDDCSRMVLHGEFLPHQRLTALEQVLRLGLLRRGYVPERLYTDNGAVFVSHQLQWICAQLGMRLLHTRPGVPQGRGKLERFFRTVREQFLLRQWREGMSLEELNRQFWHWVEMDYHRAPHQGLEGQSPLEKWVALAGQLQRRPRVEAEQLTRLFRHRAQRVVAKDRTFRLRGRLYEAPVELVGEKIEVLYELDNPHSVEVRQGGQSFGWVREVEIHVNRHIPRGIRFDREVSHA
jgi:transposase InsO family protein